MDSCQRFKEMVSDYIEGELDQQNRSLIEKHLRDCLGCKKAISQLKNLIRNLRELPKITVSADFETILRARISLARRRKISFFPTEQFRLPAYAATAVVAIVALFAVFFLIKPDSYVAPQANMNDQWYKGGVEKFDPSTNERYIYIIETQPVQNVNSQSPSNGKGYLTTDKNVTSDSIQTYRDNELWHETAQTLEPKIY